MKSLSMPLLPLTFAELQPFLRWEYSEKPKDQEESVPISEHREGKVEDV